MLGTWGGIMKLPTDREILQVIYDLYRAQEQTAMLPIDCTQVAERLGTSAALVFGRLHFHLQPKYGYENRDGTRVAFFALQAGESRYCVNLPLLSSVLAGLREDHSRYQWSLYLSIAAVVLSLVAITISLLAAILGK